MIVALAVLWASPAPAQPQTEAAKRFVALLVGAQMLAVCDAPLSPASQAKLDAELTRRRKAQGEIPDQQVATMTERLRDNLGAPANREKVCGQLTQIGPEHFVDQIVSQ